MMNKYQVWKDDLAIIITPTKDTEVAIVTDLDGAFSEKDTRVINEKDMFFLRRGENLQLLVRTGSSELKTVRDVMASTSELESKEIESIMGLG